MKAKGHTTVILENERLQIFGEIDFVTAVSLWQESLPLLANCQKLLFDFSRVTQANSAALALLLAWIRLALRDNKTIHFQHLPSQLISMTSFSGVENILNKYCKEDPSFLSG